MKILKYILVGLISVVGLLAVTYLMGPRPQFALVDTSGRQLNYTIDDLDRYVRDTDASEPTLKDDNGSQLYWADTVGRRTDYVLLFLHGFSGTHHEADPLHKSFGKRYGMNTYLHRIVDHGISDPDAFEDLTPTDLINSAKEGLAVAKLLGDQVVIMSCSTGGTYAAYLASYDKDISHLIYLSPNIALHNSTAELVSGPWGAELVEQLFGKHRVNSQPAAAKPFWQTIYHSDGIIALQALIDQTMTKKVFSEITQPTFIGCYYKDEEHQDFVVSVAAMRTFYDQISTAPTDKVFKEFPNAENHVIGSPIKAQNTEEVYQAVFAFGDRYFEERGM